MTERLLKSGLLVILLLAFYLLYYQFLPAVKAIWAFLWPLLVPFLLATVVAVVMDPTVNFFQKRWRVPRGVAVAISLGFLLAALIGGTLALALRLTAELQNFSAQYPSYASDVYNFVVGLVDRLQTFYHAAEVPQGIKPTIEGSMERALEAGNQLATQGANWLLDFVTSLPNVVMVLFFAFLGSFFFSKDKNRVRSAVYQFFSRSKWPRLDDFGEQMNRALFGFFRAQIVLMLITMAETIIGLSILRIDYILIITLVVGIADILPVLGPGAVFVPWIILVLSRGDLGLALALLILYGIITVVRQVLQPKIMGDYTGLHPLEALMGMFVGWQLVGFMGFIVGPAILVIVKALRKTGIFNSAG